MSQARRLHARARAASSASMSASYAAHALVGKYVKLHDAYLSVHEALKHSGVHHGCRVRVRWFDAENMTLEEAARELEGVDGVPSPAVRLAWVGGQGAGLSCRARARHSLPRHLPRHARRGVGVRAARGRAGGRELDRDGPGDAVSGDRPAARAEGGRGSRRHDAPRRAGRRDRRRTRARRRTRTRSSRSGTGTGTR